MADAFDPLDEARLNDARLDSLLSLTRMMDASLQAITDFALEQAVALTQSRIGYLAFASEDETILTMHSWSAGAMARCAIIDKPLVYEVACTGLWGEVVRQRRPVLTNDYAAPNPLKKGLPEGHVALVRHMNVPVFDGEKIVAVAGVGNKPIDYVESDVRQLTLLMESMWMLIHRHRVQAELRNHRDELERLVAVRTAELAGEAAHRQRAYDELRVEQERLKGLLALQERERRLFAYEIHDGLSQHLVGALMELQSLQERLPGQPADVRQVVEQAQRLVGKGLDETRQLISGLRPFSLDEFGVESAINELILRGEAHRKPRVKFISNLSGDRLDAMVENAVFRIVQECITNSRRHSQSEEMNVALIDEGDWIQILAEDWGIGFDVGRIPPGTFGLEGIRERAKLLGGHVDIDSQPGDGTRVVVRLPAAGMPA